MILSTKEIIDLGIMEKINLENFARGSYNLTLDKIITADGEVKESYLLPPQGMVVGISKEEFNLPNDILAYTTVKNSLSQKGILGINIGIVDPGYKNCISSALINFGRTSYLLKSGEPFLRMTFQKLSDAIEPEGCTFIEFPKDRKMYENDVILKAKANLDQTFLSLNNVVKEFKTKTAGEIKKEITNFGIWITIGIALFGLFLAALPPLMDYYKSYHEKSGKEITSKVQNKSIEKGDLDSLLLLLKQNQSTIINLKNGQDSLDKVLKSQVKNK